MKGLNNSKTSSNNSPVSYRATVIKDGSVSKGLYCIEYKAKLGCWAIASTRLFFTKDSAERYISQLQNNVATVWG